MPPFLFVMQIALPIAMLLWLALDRGDGFLSFAIRATGTLIFLVAIALVAPWAMPPWWTPLLYGLVWLGVVLARLSSPLSGGRTNARRTPRTISTALLTALAIYGSVQIRGAIAGRSSPAGDTIALDMPLGPGRYMVVNGGGTVVVNGHLHTADPDDPLFDSHRGEARAVDVVALDRWGFRSAGFWPSDPRRYAAFGLPVLAPCDGEVITAADGHEDQRVPEQDSAAPGGNHVVLRCGSIFVTLAHFQRGSVLVGVGDRVDGGTELGRIGNSGATTEPHLHIHAERRTTPSQSTGEPVWLLLDDRFLVRNARFIVRPEAGSDL